MSGRHVDGIERAVFGAVSEAEVDDWLVRLVRSRLSAVVQRVRFRSGRISAVYGLELGSGPVVVKVHRGQPELRSLAAAVACQLWLADHGYPAPRPIDGPAVFDGHTFAVEELRETGTPADGHDPVVRNALAASLAEQVDILGGAGDRAVGLTVRPAWAIYDHGPWPTPHDPIFDFTTTPPGYAWLDTVAREAADVLIGAQLPPSLGHGDWGSGNFLFGDGKVTSVFDWDSLIVESEPVIVGMAAGSFTAGTAPRPDEVRSFLDEYERHRGSRFDPVERAVAVHAAVWVLAYNARCQVTFLDRLAALHPTARPPTDSPLAALRDHRRDYLDVQAR